MTNRFVVRCSTDVAVELFKYSHIQICHCFGFATIFPSMLLCVHQKMQDVDERRAQKLAQGYILFSETEKHVMPIIGKCLEGMTKAGTNVNERNVS